MNTDSLELQIGTLIGQQKMILRELTNVSNQSKEHATSAQHITTVVDKLDDRMSTVEGKLTGFEPTIEEFLSIKRKVAATGKMGRWLWVIALFILTALYKMRVEMFGWPK